MKHLEGKKIALIPTGNNARCHKNMQILFATMVKVARVNVTFQIDDRHREYKYRYEGNRLYNNHNGGYLVFASIDEASEHIEAEELRRKIGNEARSFSAFKNIQVGDLRQAAMLLGVST